MEEQEIIEVLKDPVKFACVIHCLLSIKDLDGEMKKYGVTEVVLAACEATHEAFGGGTS